ncbi:hypothetical protein [Sphingorhabdus contaminans]|uniref:Uncharacterized protein n=1 Tax=Sphingorhabdus contaminans TaxID=1343899 RepID=A0A553WA80_9SPHN|nr:hypothetical protein [Sphingorhabdus contaminans]TSB01586.1 hypothetical protein FOM92_10390 [Sphingorhabdus contaminans]
MSVRTAFSAIFGVLLLQQASMGVAKEEERLGRAILQRQGATYEEVRKFQKVGRVEITSDASQFVFEWSRPYNWVPVRRGLSKTDHARQQTFLYLVKIPAVGDFSTTAFAESVFPANAGATYYLGGLSPDGSILSFYELDRDDAKVRLGIVSLSGPKPRRPVWFDVPLNREQLNRPARWLTDELLMYPSLDSGWALLNVSTGVSDVCHNCGQGHGSRTPPIKQATVPVLTLPANARQIAKSQGGELIVYLVDTDSQLSLLYTKGGRIFVLFENVRL